MKRRVRTIVLIVAVLALAGFLVSASGIISIKASSRHWPVTRWVLEFSMRRSVATHSLGIQTPEDLDRPELVRKGAGPYAISCAPCHGSPDAPNPRVAAHMTPHPPHLALTVETWKPKELFTIVKHGVKFTGMPAWPAQERDDEIWALVAFLRALPRLDAATYEQLAYGTSRDEAAGGTAPEEDLISSQSTPPPAAASCARCHADDGNGRGQAQFPRLAGQRRDYLLASLDAYARGQRHSGIMEPVAYGLDAETKQQLAEFYAKRQPAPPAGRNADPAAVARGEQLAHEGDRPHRIPSCVDCHGPEAQQPRREAYPIIAGQPADYLKLQLELFQKEQRGGSENAHLMHHVSRRLTSQQLDDLAAYFSSLSP